jgi:hypothetical protein
MIDKYIYDDSFLEVNDVIDIQKKCYQMDYKLNSRLYAKEEYVDGIHIIKNTANENNRKSNPHFPMFVAGTKDSTTEKNVSDMSMFVLEKIAKKNNFAIDGLGRTLSSILFKDKEYAWSYPHVDEAYKHFVMVYYVFDSDGDTILYNETYDGLTNYENKLTEMATIKPKAGSAIIFDGRRYHSYTRPVENDIRQVFNINFFSNNLSFN